MARRAARSSRRRSRRPACDPHILPRVLAERAALGVAYVELAQDELEARCLGTLPRLLEHGRRTVDAENRLPELVCDRDRDATVVDRQLYDRPFGRPREFY